MRRNGSPLTLRGLGFRSFRAFGPLEGEERRRRVRRHAVNMSLNRQSFLAACATEPALVANSKFDALARSVGERLKCFLGEVFLYAKNVDTGTDFRLKPDKMVRTPSTIKLPVLFAMCDLAAQGKLRWGM